MPTKMPTIKFSHRYTKLMDCQGAIVETALLLSVVKIDLANMHPDFIDYDTDCGAYTLPKKGPYLMLLFVKRFCGEPKHLFTTLRRFTPQKEIYYSQQVGKVFNIEIIQP